MDILNAYASPVRRYSPMEKMANGHVIGNGCRTSVKLVFANMEEEKANGLH